MRQTLLITLLLWIVKDGIATELGSKQLDWEYQLSLNQDFVTAPESFLPICKPWRLTLFSERKIQCACGLQCKFLCSESNDEKRSKVCRRICTQRPCLRPLERKIYFYGLAGQFCVKSRVCTFRAVCEGKQRRWLHYRLAGCKSFKQPAYGGFC